MTSMAAAIGQVQLGRLPEFIETRRANAAKLTDGLAETSVVTPTEPERMKHVYHQYTVRADDRDALQDYLNDHDIGNSVYYPKCIHDQPAYEGFKPTVPEAEVAATEALSLPVHPSVSDSDVDRIIGVIQSYDKKQN